MRPTRRCPLLVGPLALLLLGGVAVPWAGAQVPFEGLPAPEVRLIDGPQRLVGEFAHEGSAVTLTAESTARGTVTVRLDVNDVTVEAEFEPGSRRLTLGGGGRVFDDSDRRVLDNLARVLESQGLAYDPAISAERHFAFRLVLALAEAPAGLPIDRRSFVLGDLPRHLGYSPTAIEPNGSGSEPDGSCQNVDDGDGVSKLPCGVAARPVSHDACDEHGFITENRTVGCGTFVNCVGRCGAGCGFSSGTGAYTQDCADHDVCCGDHGGCLNPADLQCGDEYWEAVDDFFSSDNCSNCATLPCNQGAYCTSGSDPVCGPEGFCNTPTSCCVCY